jgi:hypothetical protein
MPKSKTIEIDEILTPEQSGGNTRGNRQDRPTSYADASAKTSTHGQGEAVPESADPFAGFSQQLPWRVRITLQLTQWFILLRAKSWGKFVIIPIVILAVVLAIPLGIIALLLLAIRSVLLPRRF